MERKSLAFTLFSLLLLCASLPATASMIGDNVDIQFHTEASGNPGVSGVLVVDPGVEFVAPFNGGVSLSVDVGAEQVTVSNSTPGATLILGSIWTVTLSDLDWVAMPGGAITGVSLQFNGVTGVTVDSFTNNSFVLDMGLSFWDPTGSVTAVLDVVHTQGTVAAPASLTVLLIGLAGLAHRFRRV